MAGKASLLFLRLRLTKNSAAKCCASSAYLSLPHSVILQFLEKKLIILFPSFSRNFKYLSQSNFFFHSILSLIKFINILLRLCF